MVHNENIKIQQHTTVMFCKLLQLHSQCCNTSRNSAIETRAFCLINKYSTDPSMCTPFVYHIKSATINARIAPHLKTVTTQVTRQNLDAVVNVHRPVQCSWDNEQSMHLNKRLTQGSQLETNFPYHCKPDDSKRITAKMQAIPNLTYSQKLSCNTFTIINFTIYVQYCTESSPL